MDMWRFVLLLTLTGALRGQSAQERAMARQRATLDRQVSAISVQRAAAARQVGKGGQAAHAFFATSWAAPSSAPLLSAAIPGGSAEAIPERNCSPLTGSEIDSIIQAEAAKNNLTPDLLRAVIRKESAFDPCAVSRKGAIGLMQLMPATAAQMKLLDPFDPAENVRAGSQYLKQMLDRYDGDLMLALSAYNAGPKRVDDAGGVPRIAETRDYVTDILRRVTASENPAPQ
jgi:soluble lytic murein transglycosylase-like protein